MNLLLTGQSVYITPQESGVKLTTIGEALRVLKNLGYLTASVRVSGSLTQFANRLARVINDSINSMLLGLERLPDTEDPVLVIISAVSQAERFAAYGNKRFVIHFDEFQNLLRLGGHDLLKKMRSVMQTQSHCTYVFSGSDSIALGSIFASRKMAFYRFAIPLVYLRDDEIGQK